MTGIVTTTYRYKRPPGKKKPVALAGPEVVTARKRKPALPADAKTLQLASAAIVTARSPRETLHRPALSTPAKRKWHGR